MGATENRAALSRSGVILLIQHIPLAHYQANLPVASAGISPRGARPVFGKRNGTATKDDAGSTLVRKPKQAEENFHRNPDTVFLDRSAQYQMNNRSTSLIRFSTFSQPIRQIVKQAFPT
jgi:hypothetical protein